MENMQILRFFINPELWLPSVLCAIIVFFVSYNILKRKRVEALVLPGLGRSSWITVGGDPSDFYYDIDKGTGDLEGLKAVSKWYINNIRELQQKQDVDYIAFIEREDGPVGALTKKDLVSFLSDLPSFIVRPKRRIVASAIKGAKDLIGKKVVVISDVATTGYSIKRVVDLIQSRGAKVIGAITILNRGGAETENLFKNEGIQFIYASDSKDLANAPAA